MGSTHLVLSYLLHGLTLAGLFVCFLRLPPPRTQTLEKETEIRRKREVGEGEGDLHYTFLPSVARVSVRVLEEFCRKGAEHCALGGSKTGVSGSRGPRGPPGPPGPQGRKGKPGKCSCSTKKSGEKSVKGEEREKEVEETTATTPSTTPSTTTLPTTTTPPLKKYFGFRVYTGKTEGPSPTTTTEREAVTGVEERPVEDESAGLVRETKEPIKKRKRKRLRPRKHTCYVTGVGEVEEKGRRSHWSGAWMAEAADHSEKRWVTEHVQGTYLLEFEKEGDLMGALPPRFITLHEMFHGTNHVVYKGAFYYHWQGTNKVVRHPVGEKKKRAIRAEKWRSRRIPMAEYQGDRFLYSRPGRNASQSYMDFATDENGLWMIYRRRGGDHIVVSKLNHKNLRVEASWELRSRMSDQLSNAFISCGVLYAVREEGSTVAISWAHDIYRNRSARVENVPGWTSLGGQLSMLNYNPGVQQLQFYDRGYMASLPLRLHFS